MTIQFDNVSFHYDEGEQIFRNLNIGIEAGDLTLIVGRNGAGKSTFLKLLNGILKPTTGTITVNELRTDRNPPSQLAAEISITFQNPSHQLFASTVLREAEFAPKSLRRPNAREDAMTALRMFRLEEQVKTHPYDLSLAHRKMLALASAVAAGTPLLAFDEPSVHLSHPERLILRRALEDLSQRGKTILIVSHDLELFLPLCKQVLVLCEGRATFFGPADELVQNHAILRRSGVRFPLVNRLRPYCGLPVIARD